LRSNREEELPRLTSGARHQKAVLAAGKVVLVDVVPGNLETGSLQSHVSHPADNTSVGLGAAQVDQGPVALSGTVKLADNGNVEPVLEGAPDLRAQTISKGYTDLVGAVIG